MKTKLSFLAFVIFFSAGSLIAETNTEIFVSSVNTNWVQRNYTNILNQINIRLTEEPDDLLALGLKVGYYFWADSDITKLELAASNFVAEINIQDSQHTGKPGYLLEQANVFSEISLGWGQPKNLAVKAILLIFKIVSFDLKTLTLRRK